MVHFPGLTRTRLCVHRAVTWFYQVGFPHSDIPGSKPACGSPRLFAACHVLHRLLAPRHPPYALSSLTIKLTQHVAFPAQETRNEFCGCRASSPFHILLCSSRICRFHITSRIRANPGRNTKCQPIQLSKNLCVRLGRTTPLLAECPLAFFEKGCETIKNPASSAGPSRPQLSGRVRAMLDCLLS